ncbi:glycoside hydrolase family 16 protein [Pontiellaceae bacterium B1224]|nr:glycoside hydrolase family 16 protein [Pontiellaceae bacterium B1224]
MFLAATCILASAQEIPGWTLVWQDEFTQANGTPPNSANWGYDTGGGGWGNSELQVYTTSTNNARIENNQLVIEARETSSGNYTSARLLTKNKWAWTYGRMEARIKVPYGQGIWPAFWMLGADYDSVGWPNCGEIDIMEHIGSKPQTVFGTIHGPGYSGDDSFGASIKIVPDITDDFHVFTVEWEADSIRWYMDGILYNIATPSNVAPDDWVFDHPFFFLLNLAVGGQWPGYPDSTTVFPQQMLVDYVRVYSLGDPPAPGTNLFENPGFESGTSDWALNLSGGTASASAAYAHGGTDSLVIDSTGAGDWSSPNASQSFPASPGDVFNIQGYMLNSAGLPITDDSFGLFKIEFRDSVGMVLEPASIDIGTSADGPYYGAESTPFLNADRATNLWIFSEAQGEAPEGTVEVSFYLLNVNPPGNSGPSMYFDDIQAMLLGEPVLPVTLSSAVSGGDIQISFLTESGVSYQMAYKSSLTNADWTPIETVLGDGDTNSTIYPASSPAGFYKVLIP